MVKIICPECGEEFELIDSSGETSDYKCPKCQELWKRGMQPTACKVIIIRSCRECLHRRYTDNAGFCIKMPMGIDNGEEVWRELRDLSIIHPLCPLRDYTPYEDFKKDRLESFDDYTFYDPKPIGKL